MYRRLTNSILFYRLPHRCIVVYDISCNFHCPFLDITFHKNFPHSLLFYNLCGEIFMYVYIEGFLIKPGHLCQCVCYLSQLICSFFDSNTQTAIYKRTLLPSFRHCLIHYFLKQYLVEFSIQVPYLLFHHALSP